MVIRETTVTYNIPDLHPMNCSQESDPILRNMVPFGTKCFVYVENHKRKLDDHPQMGVFVGYDCESPAYIVYVCCLPVLYVNYGM